MNIHTLGKTKLDSSTILEMAKKHDFDTVLVLGVTSDERQPFIAVGGLEADYADMQWLAQFSVNSVHHMAYGDDDD
jgi:hypothetical protein